jgi:SAM-dependent methyltransferase
MEPDTAIQDKEYLRKRLEPMAGDPDYLHLADLLEALEPHRTEETISILDYGCGGSPYRSLFPNAVYKRADFGAMADLDYVIGNDSRISESDESFDMVLSTQVAEHVMDPAGYFAECFRLLKPGGRLICSTHGAYPDHGCPYDFQRWTANGLTRDLEQAGFTIEKVLKLTTNGRALMYMIQKFSGWFESPSGFSAPLFRIFRSIMHRSPSAWHRLSDRAFATQRVVEASEIGNEFYIGLLIAARKTDAGLDR